MTGLEQVSAQLDSPEGATTPWPTYTVPPVARVVPVIRHPLQLPGNNDRSRPKPIIENDILFKAIANWDNICRFDNITPASLCKVAAATIAPSLPSFFTQYDGARSSSHADSGAPTNSRNHG